MLLSLLRFQLRNFLKSNKFIVPLVVFLAYQAMAYSIIPVDVLPSFTLSATVSFLVMVWLGFSFNEAEAAITEQILFIKVKRKSFISISKVLVMLIFGSFLAVLGTMYPLVLNIIHNGKAFTRMVVFTDVVYSLMLHMIYSLVGSLIGLIFHGRIIKKRKEALLIVIFIALITLIKGSLEQDIPIIRMVSWLFPPIYSVSTAGTTSDYLNIRELIIPLSFIIVYLGAEVIIYIKLTKYKLFT